MPPPPHFSLRLFQHASNLEQKQNETENKKVHGDVVKYGTVLQVDSLTLRLASSSEAPAPALTLSPAPCLPAFSSLLVRQSQY